MDIDEKYGITYLELMTERASYNIDDVNQIDKEHIFIHCGEKNFLFQRMN